MFGIHWNRRLQNRFSGTPFITKSKNSYYYKLSSLRIKEWSYNLFKNVGILIEEAVEKCGSHLTGWTQAFKTHSER